MSERRRKRRGRDPRAISIGLRARVLERDGFRCRRCGSGPDTARLVVDHRIPVARGGTAEFHNLQTLCDTCNSGKGAREPHPHDLRLVPADGDTRRPVEPPRRYQPHPDTCRECRDRYGYEPAHYATTILAEDPQGFRAWYRCHRGHKWTCWWSWGSEIDSPERNPLPGRVQHFDNSFSARAGVTPYVYVGVA